MHIDGYPQCEQGGERKGKSRKEIMLILAVVINIRAFEATWGGAVCHIL